MKKKLILGFAAALSLSVAGTALAAPANPFVDVSVSHWAYEALAQLQKNGVIDGYGEGSFRGDRNLTRYEMAAIVAKINNTGADDALVKKLRSEFANELYTLGVRVDALEQGASTIKISGSSRIRYRVGNAGNIATTKKDSDNINGSFFNHRTNLIMSAKVNERVNFFGVASFVNNNNIYTNSGSKTSNTAEPWLDRAEFVWNNNNLSVHAGRLAVQLGSGTLWKEKADGFMVGYKLNDKVKVSTGYIDLAAVTPNPTYNKATGTSSSMNAFVADVKIKANDRVDFAAGYLDVINPQDSSIDINGKKYGYNFKQWAVGATVKLGNDFKIRGEYLENTDAPAGGQKKATWGRVQWKDFNMKKPGSYMIFADYVKMGNWAVDSTANGHGFTNTIVNNIYGGNGLGRDGAKGWGLGGIYVPAKNVNLEVYYYDLKSYAGDFKYKKSYSISTTFLF